MRNIFFYILVATFLSTCGQKGSTANFNVSVLSFSGSAFSQEVVLMGKEVSTGETFQEVITTNDFEKTLDQGQWSFLAFTWDGGAAFSGNLLCSEIVEQNFDTSDVTVSLSLSVANCLDSRITPSGGVDTYATPNVPYVWNLSVCNHDALVSNMLSGYCGGSYVGQATGIKLSLPSYDQTETGTTLESGCLKLSSGSAYSTGARLPGLDTSTLPIKFVLDTYHSANGSSCNGTDCCTGKQDTYKFYNGVDGGADGATHSLLYSSYSNTFLFTEKEVEKKLVFDTSLTSLVYNQCTPVTVNLEENGSSYNSSAAFAFTPTCNGECTFYTDGSCTSSATVMNFPAATSSYTFYTMVTTLGAKSFNNGGDSSEIGGSSLSSVPVTIAYSDITPALLNSMASIGSASSVYVNSATLVAGAYVVYETVSGNRGKFILNSRTTTTLTDDTLNFDFVTWDSSGSVVASGTGITSKACFSSGDCFLDFDINAGKLSPSSISGQTDVWWQTSGPNVYFSVQASKPFRVMGP